MERNPQGRTGSRESRAFGFVCGGGEEPVGKKYSSGSSRRSKKRAQRRASGSATICLHKLAGRMAHCVVERCGQNADRCTWDHEGMSIWALVYDDGSQ